MIKAIARDFLKSFKIGAGHQKKSQMRLKGWNFQLNFQGREEVLEIEFNNVANNLINISTKQNFIKNSGQQSLKDFPGWFTRKVAYSDFCAWGLRRPCLIWLLICALYKKIIANIEFS